jgi:phage terminase large subunit
MTGIDRFLQAAKSAGCRRDQFANFLRLGLVLTPKQCVASSLARLCDESGGPTELAYGGARGGGKSFWLLAQMAEDCLRYPGLKCLLLRKVGTSGREGFEDLLPRVLGGISYKYIPSSNVLVFPNGSRIKLGHFKDEKDVDKYLGLEYDVIGVEEATTLSGSKYKMIRTCNRTSKPGWRPRIYSTTNPGGIGHDWYKRRFIDPARGGDGETTTRFVGATVDDNPFINPEYVGILDSLTGWQYRAWRLGDWDIASGQYFSTFSRQHHGCGRFGELPRHWRYWLSFDYGFKHYTAVYLFAQTGDGDVYAVDEHAEQRWRPDQHAAAMDAMIARHGLRRDQIETTVAGGDCWQTESDGKNVVDAYAEHGWHFERANMSRTDRPFELLYRLGDPGNPDESRRKRQTLWISESCPLLLSCIPAMVHDEHHPEKCAKVDADEDGIGGDDPYDAATYGLMYVSGGPRVTMLDSPIAGYRG